MSSNPAGAVNNFPFMYFGHRLWRLRERRGMRTIEVANFLNILPHDYRKYEAGEKLPDVRLMLDLSRILKVDLGRLKQWEQYAKRKLEDQPLKGALAHSKALTDAIERVKATYQEMTELEPKKEVIDILNDLQKDVFRILTLPILPMNFLMVLDALQEAGPNIKYLHEITDFLIEKESFAGFLSRDFYLGPFIFFAANINYFATSPCQNISDCFNRLTIEQFKELIYIATNKYGVYSADQEIPEMQQQGEFTSLAALMVKELEPHLPKNIDFNQLYTAVLTQGIGIFVLHTLLQPSLRIRERQANKDRGGINAALDENLFDLIVYEVHPVISAMISSNWNLPVEVQNILITHHDRVTKEVSPACAVLKLINIFTDRDFPSYSKEDLKSIMEPYPQVDIPLESLFQVCLTLNKMRKQLIEKSSSILEDMSGDAANYASDKISKIKQNPVLSIKENTFNAQRSDFRFDPGYQKALVNSCQARLADFLLRILSPKKNETIEDFQQRMGTLQLRLELTQTQDVLVVAQKFKTTVDELKARLGIP